MNGLFMKDPMAKERTRTASEDSRLSTRSKVTAYLDKFGSYIKTHVRAVILKTFLY